MRQAGTRERKRSRAIGLRGVKHAHEHVVESLKVADPVRLDDSRVASAVARPAVEVAREVGAGAYSRTARALGDEGLVDSVRDVRRRDELGKEVGHVLALGLHHRCRQPGGVRSVDASANNVQGKLSAQAGDEVGGVRLLGQPRREVRRERDGDVHAEPPSWRGCGRARGPSGVRAARERRPEDVAASPEDTEAWGGTAGSRLALPWALPLADDRDEDEGAPGPPNEDSQT